MQLRPRGSFSHVNHLMARCNYFVISIARAAQSVLFITAFIIFASISFLLCYIAANATNNSFDAKLPYGIERRS